MPEIRWRFHAEAMSLVDETTSKRVFSGVNGMALRIEGVNCGTEHRTFRHRGKLWVGYVSLDAGSLDVALRVLVRSGFVRLGFVNSLLYVFGFIGAHKPDRNCD